MSVEGERAGKGEVLREKSESPADVRGTSKYERALGAGKTEPAKFKADSLLIRELGERLVGRPYIALAELIKNAYDADASKCEIVLEEDRIMVSDDGHGMTKREFFDHWMTIGTGNKTLRSASRDLKRPVTGSKGVGRLAAQFLAHRMQLLTTATNANRRLRAFVDWDEAVEAGLLTEAVARWRLEATGKGTYPDGSPRGTTVIMEGLKQDWDEEEIRELGHQVWMLNAPVPNFGKTTRKQSTAGTFTISLRTTMPGVDIAFAQTMTQALENYNAVIDGEIIKERGQNVSVVTVRLGDKPPQVARFPCGSVISQASWQIRVYDLSGKQKGGISVHDMRDYFEKYGGVLVYDAGFRLPYYGAENDWLGLEFDHSHRRSKSDLLPADLHVSRALNDLPTQGRIFGIVNVNTGEEQQRATAARKASGEYLKIQVSRDRLVGNQAFDVLRRAVRQSIDFYASRKREQAAAGLDVGRPREAAAAKVKRIQSMAAELTQRMPEDETATELAQETEDLARSLKNEGEQEQIARSILGPLASTGMIALAMEHETRKEIAVARSSVRKLKRIATRESREELTEIANRLSHWLDRTEQTRRMLLPMLDEEDRETVQRYSASKVVEMALDNLKPFLGPARTRLVVDEEVRLPAATITEWYSVLQNVILNAVNATLDSDSAKIGIRIFRNRRHGVIEISDNGTGVDVESSEELFKPFVRSSAVSEERRELGLGGTGLGLTIVDLILTQRNAEARFVEPEGDWSTTLQITWREAAAK